MVDVEANVFNALYPVVAPLCAKNKFTNIQVTTPTAFPAVSLFEIGNSTVRNRQSSTPVENFSRLGYQMDVYAQKKAQCREVFKAADERMIRMNFTRISGNYIDNPANPEVFRYTARYEAVADTDGNLYRT